MPAFRDRQTLGHKRGRTRKAKRYSRKLGSLTVRGDAVTVISRKPREVRTVKRSWSGAEYANGVRQNVGAAPGAVVRLAEFQSESFAPRTFLVVRINRGLERGSLGWARRKLLQASFHYGFNATQVSGDGNEDHFSLSRVSAAAVKFLKSVTGSLPGDILCEMHERKRPLPGTGSGEFMPEYRKPKSRPARRKAGLPSMPTMASPGVYNNFGGGAQSSQRASKIDGHSLYIG